MQFFYSCKCGAPAAGPSSETETGQPESEDGHASAASIAASAASDAVSAASVQQWQQLAEVLQAKLRDWGSQGTSVAHVKARIAPTLAPVAREAESEAEEAHNCSDKLQQISTNGD